MLWIAESGPDNTISPGNIGAKHEVSGENFSPLFSNRYIIRALEKLEWTAQRGGF